MSKLESTIVVKVQGDEQFDRMCEALRDLKVQEERRIRWSKIDSVSNLVLAVVLVALAVAAFVLAR